MLSAKSGFMWIDAGPGTGGVLADASRLLCHAWIDAAVVGTPWDPTEGIAYTADRLELDTDALAVATRWRAVSTWSYITKHAPQRRWESTGAARLAAGLS